MTISQWLVALVGPIAARVLVSLGFTAVSFAGVTALTDQLVQMAKDQWAALPSAVLQLASLSGIPQALGMIFGAYLAWVGVWAVQNGTKYLLR